MTTILHLDDEAPVRAAVAEMLGAVGFRVHGFATPQALREVLAFHPSCLLLFDMKLGETTGLETLKAIRADGIILPCVFLSGQADMSEVIEAMRMIHVDFLLKPFDPLDLVATLRALAKRSYGTDRSGPSKALTTGNPTLGQPFEPLSQREAQVFSYIIKGYTNQQIAHLLSVKADTVKKHRARILEKYGVASLAGLIEKLGVLRALN